MIPRGVEIALGKQVTPETKKPLPNDFLKTKKKPIRYITPETTEQSDTQIIYIEKTNTSDVQNTGTITVNSVSQPICSTSEIHNTINKTNEQSKENEKINEKQIITQKIHCSCCVLLRKICKQRQTLITEYIKSKNNKANKCPCKSKQRQRITNKLRMLLRFFKHRSMYVHKDMSQQLSQCMDKNGFNTNVKDNIFEIEDIPDPNDLGDTLFIFSKNILKMCWFLYCYWCLYL